jgi:murein DD-endopeptidase MepM/ murein hydrolase activator NlpD
MPAARRPWWKELNRRLTIMVVPHGTARPRQITFSVPFTLFLFVLWTGFTGWSAYIASQKFDYWRAKANAHLMRIKVDYFAGQLKHSQEMLDEVKVMDRQLRTLLNMGSHEAIVQSADDQASGGPTPLDEALLSQALQGQLAEPALRDISSQVNQLRRGIQVRVDSFKEISGRIDQERRTFRYTPRGWPVNGYLTSPFGHRIHPLTGLPEFHDGLDIAGPPGTPIRATADGVVQLAGWASGYGKVVVIDHLYAGYSTRYGHNRQLLVRRGDRVKRGQIICLMGETGDATGPHCHYEVRINGKPLNPRPYLGPADF